MKKVICVLLACAIFILPACSGKKAEDTRWPAEAGGYTFTAPPKRVVSLSPSVTESLYMLGYGGRLAGVGDFCRLPGSAERLPQCGSALLPDLERIKKLSPDLLFSPAELSGHDKAALEEAGIRIVVVGHPETFEDMLQNCRLICTAFEGAEKAAQRIRELESFFEVTLQYIADGAAEQTGDVEMSAIFLRKLPFVMATGDSLENELLSLMGFANPAGQYGNWSYPSEQAAELDPDYIFCDDSIDIGDLQKSDYYKATGAVTNERVFRFDFAAFERRTPRMLFALEQLMKEAFPEGFEEEKPDFTIELSPPPPPEKSWWQKIPDIF